MSILNKKLLAIVSTSAQQQNSVVVRFVNNPPHISPQINELLPVWIYGALLRTSLLLEGSMSLHSAEPV